MKHANPENKHGLFDRARLRLAKLVGGQAIRNLIQEAPPEVPQTEIEPAIRTRLPGYIQSSEATLSTSFSVPIDFEYRTEDPGVVQAVFHTGQRKDKDGKIIWVFSRALLPGSPEKTGDITPGDIYFDDFATNQAALQHTRMTLDPPGDHAVFALVRKDLEAFTTSTYDLVPAKSAADYYSQAIDADLSKLLDS